MANYFSATFLCNLCESRWDELVERELKDEEHEVECPRCETKQISKRSIAAPMNLKASYPDGWRRKHDDTWKKTKEAAEIKIEEVALPFGKKRVDHIKERSKLTRTKKPGQKD